MIRALLPLLMLIGCAPAQRASVRRTVEALGTQVTIQVSAPDRASALAASEALLQALEVAEARLSTWREDTELASLNRSALGLAVSPSPQLSSEIGRAFALRESTQRAFDPAVGPLVQAWSLRDHPSQPSPTKLEEALEAASAGFEWNAVDGTLTRRHADAALEEGAWGKGAALDAALEIVRPMRDVAAFVDLGGQYGYVHESGSISVADPRGRDLPPVASIDFKGEGSIATTGNSERGLGTGHILDPRTGRPARDFGSVTVWAKDALTADALSTAFFVLGPERALEFAQVRDGVEALVVVLSDPDQPDSSSLQLRATSGLRKQLRSHSPHPPADFTNVR